MFSNSNSSAPTIKQEHNTTRSQKPYRRRHLSFSVSFPFLFPSRMLNQRITFMLSALTLPGLLLWYNHIFHINPPLNGHKHKTNLGCSLFCLNGQFLTRISCNMDHLVKHVTYTLLNDSFLSHHPLLAIVIASAAMHDQYVWFINGGMALTANAGIIYLHLGGGVWSCRPWVDVEWMEWAL